MFPSLGAAEKAGNGSGPELPIPQFVAGNGRPG